MRLKIPSNMLVYYGLGAILLQFYQNFKFLQPSLFTAMVLLYKKL